MRQLGWLLLVVVASALLARWRPADPPLPVAASPEAVALPSIVPGGVAHVIGVYESILSDHGWRPDDTHYNNGISPINVTLAAAEEPYVLVLSAYEPIRWQLTLAPGARLARVFLNDYWGDEFPAEVTGSPIPVTRCELGGYPYMPDSREKLEADRIRACLREIQVATGCARLDFQGDYAGANFRVTQDTKR